MQDLGIYPLPNGSPFEGNLCLICPILIFFLYVFNLSIRAYMLYSINSLVLVSVFVGQRFDDAVFLYDSISLLWLKRFKNEGGVLFFIGYGCN